MIFISPEVAAAVMHGPFTQLDGLLAVPGIGQATLNGMAGLITL